MSSVQKIVPSCGYCCKPGCLECELAAMRTRTNGRRQLALARRRLEEHRGAAERRAELRTGLPIGEVRRRALEAAVSRTRPTECAGSQDRICQRSAR